jgi:hypothetical protein
MPVAPLGGVWYLERASGVQTTKMVAVRARTRRPRIRELTSGLIVVAGVLSGLPADAQPSSPAATVLVDQEMTPTAGAADVLAVQGLFGAFEDRLLPVRLPESTPSGHALGIAYRIGKWAALDLPQDGFLMVAAHEIFGHGARLREIGAAGIGYQFNAPPPYGSGSAATRFDEESFQTASRADRLAIDAAGIEAQNVLADDIAAEALAGGSVSYRAAWLYAQSRIASLLYIRSVSPQSDPGHDVAAFLGDFNSGCVPPVCTPLESASLKNRALLMLADPILALSAYAFVESYLVQGHASGPMPMFSLPHGYAYLPAVGFAMTSYGTEWTTDHYVRARDRLMKFSIRMGDTGAARAWGLGVRAPRAIERGRVVLDLSLDFWRQPPIDASTATASLATGGLAAATVHVALGGSQAPRRVGLIGEFGCKSDGFVRGERLRGGAIVRVGLTIPITFSERPRTQTARPE